MSWWMYVGPAVLAIYALVVHLLTENLRKRSAAIVGSLLFLWSFFVLPAITLDPFCAAEVPLDTFSDLVGVAGADSDIVDDVVTEEVVAAGAAQNYLYSLAISPPAFLLSRYYPSLQFDLLFLIILWVPVLFAITVFVFSILSLTSLLSGLQKFFGTFISIVGLLVIFPLLVFSLPMIDAWGTQGQLLQGLAALALNVNLGWGPWIALMSVVLMIVGGERIEAAAEDIQSRRGGRSANPLAGLVSTILGVPGKAFAVLGSILFLVSFFALPWISYDPGTFSSNLTNVNDVTRVVAEPLCLIQGQESICNLFRSPWPFTAPGTESMFNTMDAGGRLTGIAILGRPFTSNLLLYVVLIASLATSMLILLWSGYFYTQFDNSDDVPLNQVIVAILGPLTFVLAISFLAFFPDVETLGTRGNFELNLLSKIAGSSVGIGAVVGLLGMLLATWGGLREIVSFLGDNTVRRIALGVGSAILTVLAFFIIHLVTGPLTDDCGFGPMVEAPALREVNICENQGVNQPISTNVPALGEEDAPPPEQLDILFLIDVTSSMGDVIDSVQTNASFILSDINTLSGDVQFGVATYADYPLEDYGADGDYPFRLETDLTSDLSTVQSGIDSASLLDGGDFGESLSFAVSQARPLSWRPNARKIIILFTDAPPHDPVFDTGIDPGPDREFNTADDLRYSEVINDLRTDNISVVAVNSFQYNFGLGLLDLLLGGTGDLGGSETEQALRQITRETSGIYIELDDVASLPSRIVEAVDVQVQAQNLLTVSLTNAEFNNWLIVEPQNVPYPNGGGQVDFDVTIDPGLGNTSEDLYELELQVVDSEDNVLGSERINVDYSPICR